ncbi:MAG: hypothetical protein LBJ08_09905 [Bifidobacteriaceae bacterium]|jgi:hypothetical protein|nr:hypothetical protein [Bifidobacteriaceae bacterium]
MVSWREGVPQETQDDFDMLFDRSLDCAVELLGKSRALYPFAFTLSNEGEVAMHGSLPSESATADEAEELLVAGLTGERDRFRAVAVAYTASVTGDDGAPADAVVVKLGHRDGVALNIYAWYTVKWRHRVALGRMATMSGTLAIWPPSGR